MGRDVDGWAERLPLPWQRHCIRLARRHLPSRPGVLAVWVAGSLARGCGDIYSDVDLHCLVRDESISFWRARWPVAVAECVGELVLARTIDESIVGGFGLTADWCRVDLVVHPESTFEVPVECRAIHDPQGFLEGPETDSDEVGGDIAGMYEFFFYLAGSFAAPVGRGELVVAQRAVVELREWLIRLMVTANGGRRGGRWRLNEFLTVEQRAELEGLLGVSTSLEGTTAAARAVFESFVRRGRELADRTGVEFPERLRRSAERRLHRELGSWWPVSGSVTD